jgi:hypothetical protein
MKTNGGNGYIDPRISDLGTSYANVFPLSIGLHHFKILQTKNLFLDKICICTSYTFFML